MSVANTYEAIQQETGLRVLSTFMKTVLGICMFAGPCLTGIIGYYWKWNAGKEY